MEWSGKYAVLSLALPYKEGDIEVTIHPGMDGGEKENG